MTYESFLKAIGIALPVLRFPALPTFSPSARLQLSALMTRVGHRYGMSYAGAAMAVVQALKAAAEARKRRNAAKRRRRELRARGRRHHGAPRGRGQRC